MTRTAYANIAPTQGNDAGTFEWQLDIAVIPTGGISALTETNWISVPDINSLTPTPAPKLKDSTTYANKGNTRQSKTGEDFTATVSIKGVKDNTGEFQPELLVLLAAADAVGQANNVAYRYYHATSGALAWNGSAAVNWTRANTGTDDLEWFDLTLTGQGDRAPITNPNLS